MASAVSSSSATDLRMLPVQPSYWKFMWVFFMEQVDRLERLLEKAGSQLPQDDGTDLDRGRLLKSIPSSRMTALERRVGGSIEENPAQRQISDSIPRCSARARSKASASSADQVPARCSRSL